MSTTMLLPVPPVSTVPPVRRRVVQLMGMPISLALRGRHADTTAGRQAWEAVLAELREVDRTFSTYRDDSAVSRFNRGELTLDGCPADVTAVLSLARQAEEESSGAFSVWATGPDGRRRLDPSGVVKGWAVERAARLLEVLEDTDTCLSAGGDLVGRVVDPSRPAWRVGVENPSDPSRMLAVIPVRAAAVATSGTAHRGSHLVDRRSGLAVEGVASVTVIADSLTWADIDATAAYVHGREAATWLAGRAGRSGFVVWPDGTTTTVDGRLPSPT